MDSIQELFSSLGWREAVVLCIVVVTIYFVIAVLRFLQLPRADRLSRYDLRAPEMRTVPPEFDAPPGTALAGVWDSPTEPRLDAFAESSVEPRTTFEPRSGFSPEALAEAVPAVAPRSVAPVAEIAADDFAAQLNRKSLESEVRQLREQLAESRLEIQRMSQEIGRLSAAQKVSPLYNEAMSMAVRGVDAAGVAGRCGISIAEAELVVALSKRPGTNDSEESGYGREARGA